MVEGSSHKCISEAAVIEDDRNPRPAPVAVNASNSSTHVHPVTESDVPR